VGLSFQVWALKGLEAMRGRRIVAIEKGEAMRL
jgi:hypothetical protein